MATVLGKRKTRTATAEAPAISPEEAQEMLRRHFEAQFQPLDVGGSSTAPGKDVDGLDDDRSEESDAQDGDEEEEDDDDYDEDSNDDEEDEWDGVSDSEAKTPAAPQIEVVEHVSVPNPASARADPALKRETKAYLSSRVPTAGALSAAAAGASTKKGKGGGVEGEDETSAALLRNDLALQRLLSESHLFTAPPLGGGGGAAMEHAGRNRHLATDLRLAALGSKGSIYKQAKMPMAHRKGIIAAAETREARRRREARENGIVLEKPTAGVHEGWTGLKNARKHKKAQGGAGAGGSRMRDAAVDAPAVGKLRNGMLQLSKKDVQSIQGSGDGGRRGGGGGRGGKRRRR